MTESAVDENGAVLRPFSSGPPDGHIDILRARGARIPCGYAQIWKIRHTGALGQFTGAVNNSRLPWWNIRGRGGPPPYI